MALPAQFSEAVERFDALYGEMDTALWCLSRHCRPLLLEGDTGPEIEALVWTLKSWWSVQGVPKTTRQAMAEALACLDWSAELFEATSGVPALAATSACDRVAELVRRSQEHGATRREYSLASKVLHWLLPWRVPVYDSFVRKSLRVPADWDHPRAYAEICQKIFAEIRVLDPEVASIGSVEPRSPLRAYDKYLWWIGGGSAETAVLVRDPWKPIDVLGLPRL